MTNMSGTYKPDERALGLLSELEQGTIDEGGLEYLKALYQKDPNFAAFYTTWKNALNGKKGQQTGTQRANRSERNSYLQSRNSASGYSSTNRTISPGGFKKSGLDEDSMARRSGTMTDPNFAKSMVNFNYRKVKDGNGNVTDVLTGITYGNGKRRKNYSLEQMQWLLDRGGTGATLGQADQVVYDAILQKKAEEKRAKDEANAIGAYAKANADKNAIKLQEENRKLQQELAKMRYRNQLSAQSAREKADYTAQAKRKAIEDQHAVIRQQYEIPDDAVISDQGYKDIASGKKKWDYSPSDRKEVERLYEEMSELERSKDFTAEDKALMMEMYNSEIDGFKKKLVDSKEPTTTEQKIAQARANGGYYTNNKDELVVLPESPEERRANVEADKALRREERLQDIKANRENAVLDAKMKFIDQKVKGAEADWNNTPENEGKPFDRSAAIDDALARWDAYYAKAAPAQADDAEIGDNDPETPEWYGDNSVQTEQGSAPEPVAPIVQTPDVSPEPTSTPRQSNGNVSWRAKLGVEDSVAEPPEDNFYASAGLCPQCGAELDANGYCATCGYQV